MRRLAFICHRLTAAESKGGSTGREHNFAKWLNGANFENINLCTKLYKQAIMDFFHILEKAL